MCSILLFFYITHGIIMAYIDFAKDQYGNNPVLEHLRELRNQANAKDEQAIWLLARISRAMEFIRRHGIPDSLTRTLVANDDMNLPFTLVEPVKKLIHQKPFLELRVNKPSRTGAYRAIFFPYMHEENQILIFTNYVIKNDTSSLAFDRIVEEAQAMLPYFLKNPSNYINI